MCNYYRAGYLQWLQSNSVMDKVWNWNTNVWNPVKPVSEPPAGIYDVEELFQGVQKPNLSGVYEFSKFHLTKEALEHLEELRKKNE